MKIEIYPSELVEFEEEDDGHARIAVCVGGVWSDVQPTLACSSEDAGLFVKIQSWSDSMVGDPDDNGHALTNLLEGRRIKITIETMDDDVAEGDENCLRCKYDVFGSDGVHFCSVLDYDAVRSWRRKNGLFNCENNLVGMGETTPCPKFERF